MTADFPRGVLCNFTPEKRVCLDKVRLLVYLQAYLSFTIPSP